MLSRIRQSLAFGIILCAAALHGQATPASALLAISKTDHMLAIVDPGSLKILARIPVGADPHEIVASTDGKFAFVSNYGGGTYNTITPIDLVAQKAMPPVDLGGLRGPHGLTFVGGMLWFTAEAADAIGRLDPATGKVDWIFGTGQGGTHMIFVTEAMKRVITSNVRGASVSIIERREPSGRGGAAAGAPMGTWDQTVVAVGRGAEGFDVSPNGTEIWIANAQDATISIIDVATKKVVQTLDANVPGANRLKFTPDGKRVLVAAQGQSSLSIFDAATRAPVKRIAIGSAAAGIQIQPDGGRAFIACSPDNYIAVVDLKTMEIVGRLEVGGEPDGIAWAVRH